MKKITFKDCILLIIGGIIFPIITEFITPYLLKEWQEPVYSISKHNELFGYDGEKPDNISMIINDTISVTNNVNLYEIIFWNNGKKEIEESDVRVPFIIKPPKGNEFVYFDIVKSINPDISGFYFLKKGTDYEIKWKYFEPNFGFKVQAIVLGDHVGVPIIEGYVPQHRIKKVELPFEPIKNNIRWALVLIWFVLSTISIYKIIKIPRKKIKFKHLLIPIVLLIISVFRIFYYVIYTYHPPYTLY